MKQLVKFCLVGCLNFGISYAVFLLSYRYWPFSAMLTALPGGMAESVSSGLGRMGVLSIDAALSNMMGFTAGMANSFLWNRLWTFGALENPHQQAGRFIATNLGCLSLSTASIFICTDLNQIPYNPVWIITMLFVTIINFIVSKYWVFTDNATRKQPVKQSIF